MSTIYLCAPTWQTVGALPVDCNTTVTSGKKSMGHAFPTIALMAAVSSQPGRNYWKTCPIEEWLAIMNLRQAHGHFKGRHPKWRSCFQTSLCSSTMPHFHQDLPTSTNEHHPALWVSEAPGHRRYPRDLPAATGSASSWNMSSIDCWILRSHLFLFEFALSWLNTIVVQAWTSIFSFMGYIQISVIKQTITIN